jgi:gliding motility-associated-like protein
MFYKSTSLFSTFFLFICLVYSLVFSTQIFAQGAMCSLSQPLCASSGVTFPAGTNQPNAPTGPNYGCLLTRPNPAWYVIQIETSGNITLNISNSAFIDVDYAIWGPFAPGRSVESICAGNMDNIDPRFIPGATGTCDYSTGPGGTAILNNVTAGSMYVLLITNFANTPTDITVVQSGTATTNCTLRSSNALNFDGNNDVVNIPAGINIANQSFTVEFWAKRIGDGNEDIAFSQGNSSPNNSLRFGFTSVNQFLFSIGGSNLTVNPSLSDNNWHHWACVYDATVGVGIDRKIYRDGVLVASDDVPADYGGSGQILLGDNLLTPNLTSLFRGELDDLRIWQEARSECDISSYKDVRLLGTEPNLVAYYDFDEGTAGGDNPTITTLPNKTPAGTALDGTLSNFTLSGLVSNWVSHGVSGILGGDIIRPVITCVPNKTQNVDAASCQAIVNGIDALATDNCGVASLTWTKTGATVASSPTTGINQVSGTSFNLGVTTVTYTVKDAAGNSATCTFTVTVVDNILPVLTCPADITISSPTSCTLNVANINAVFSDNCTQNRLTWTKTGATVASSPLTGINQVSNTPFNVGVTVVTYTLRDAGNNIVTCSFEVTVVDNVNPTLTCVPNRVLNVGAMDCSPIVDNIDATFNDNCGVTSLTWTKTGATVANSPLMGFHQASGTFFRAGITTVTYTAKDAAGNTSTCSFTVTVIDNIPPTIFCPPNMLRCGGAGIVNPPNPILIDNCLVTTLTWQKTGATVASSPPTGINFVSGTNFNIGITTVTYTVRDIGNNIATCSFTIEQKLPPIPIVTISQTNICEGEVFTLSSPAPPAGSDFEYTWYENGLEIGNTRTLILTATQAGSFVYRVKMRDKAFTTGCEAVSLPVTLNVEQAPNTDLLLSGATSFCEGQTLTLTAATAPTGQTFIYEWLKNDTIIAGQTTNELLVTQSGNYKLKITVVGGCSRNSAAINVVVSPFPLVAISNLQADYCANRQEIKPIGSPSGGFFKINGTAFQPPYIPESLGAGTHELKYIFYQATGCSDSVTTSFVVKPLPIVKITTTINPTYCVSDAPFVLNATPLGGTFFVNTGSTDINIGTNNTANSINFNPALYGVQPKVWIKYRYTAANGCTNTDSTFIDLITKPIVNVGADRMICKSVGSVTVSALHPTHSTQTNYYWTNLASGQVLGTNAALTITETGSYAVRVTDQRACLPNYDTIRVQFNNSPLVDLGADKLICGNQKVVLRANALQNNIGNFKYIWSNNVSGISAITADSLVLQSDTLSGTRTYTVKVIDENYPSNCSTEEQIVINFQKSPTVNLGANRQICSPSQVPFTLEAQNIANNALNVSYKWYNLFGATPSAVIGTNPTLSITERGLYVAELTSAGGCVARDSVQILLDANPDFRILGNENSGRCQTTDTLYIVATNVLNYDIEWSGAGIAQISADKLQVIVNQSGRYTATVRDKVRTSACETVLSVDVFIADFPKAEITPSSTQKLISVCQDSVLTLNAAQANHLPSFTYIWRNLSNNQVVGNGKTLQISYATVQNFGLNRFSVQVTPPSGCSSADTISVQFQPKAIAAINPDYPRQICIGESFVLRASGGDTYKWTSSEPNNAINNQSATIAIKPLLAGTYTYTVEVSNKDSEKVCKPTKTTITVIVNSKPIAKASQKTVKLCEDNSQTISLIDSTHTAAIRYSWKSLATNEIIGTAATQLFTFGNAKPNPSYNPSSYEATVLNIETGCFSKDTVTVTFVRKARPQIRRDFRPAICLGDSLRLTATQGANYVWNTGQKGETITVSPKQTGFITYKVSATFDTLCSRGEDSIQIQVLPIPTVKAHSTREVSICVGESATLRADGGADGVQFEWLTGQRTQQITVSPKQDTKYFVRTFNRLNCPSGFDSVLVRVTPRITLPKLTFLCEGQTTVLNATHPDSDAKYSWNVLDSESKNIITPTLQIVKEGIYTVTITVRNCTFTETAEVRYIEKPKIGLDSVAVLCFAINGQIESRPYRTFKHTISGNLLNRKSGVSYYYEWRLKGSNESLFNGFIGSDNATPLEISKLDTSYTLYIRTGDQTVCENSATIRVNTYCDARIKFPTAFTPNGDKLNDYFAPITSDLEGIRLMVFHRWGDLVYEKFIDPQNNGGWNGIFEEKDGWDGTFGGNPSPIDSYQYVVIYWSRNRKGELIETKQTGAVQIVREMTR